MSVEQLQDQAYREWGWRYEERMRTKPVPPPPPDFAEWVRQSKSKRGGPRMLPHDMADADRCALAYRLQNEGLSFAEVCKALNAAVNGTA